MKLTFKRSGHVYLGKYQIGYLWKPDSKRRFTMGKKGVWNFQFSSDVKVGQGLKMLRDLGLEWSYTDPRMNVLKETVRKEFTASRIKKIVKHCKEVENRQSESPTLSERERKELSGFIDALNGAAKDMFRKP